MVDEWLELKFPSSEKGQEVLSAIQTMRSMWSHLLEIKLQASQCKVLVVHDHPTAWIVVRYDEYL